MHTLLLPGDHKKGFHSDISLTFSLSEETATPLELNGAVPPAGVDRRVAALLFPEAVSWDSITVVRYLD